MCLLLGNDSCKLFKWRLLIHVECNIIVHQHAWYLWKDNLKNLNQIITQQEKLLTIWVFSLKILKQKPLIDYEDLEINVLVFFLLIRMHHWKSLKKTHLELPQNFKVTPRRTLHVCQPFIYLFMKKNFFLRCIWSNEPKCSNHSLFNRHNKPSHHQTKIRSFYGRSIFMISGILVFLCN